MTSRPLLAFAAAFAAAFPLPAAAAQTAPSAAPDYAKDSVWLCLPGRQDVCASTLPTTPLKPSGFGKSVRPAAASDAGVDCFYVYPTVSNDPGLNSDLVVGNGEEKFAALAQLARFASVCRTFAPIYRQMTQSAVAAFAVGSDVSAPAALAYGDVRAAFRQYLRERSGGRPFVLIGHSQGSALLQQLIAREIEPDPALARRMLLAIIPGYNLLVPRGRVIGGTFKSTPLCTREGETHCALSWTSFREKNAPPPGATFGYADEAGMTVACTNPARPGATGWQPFDSVWYARSSMPVPGGPIRWSSEGPPPTPWLATQGLVSGRCVNDGPRGYLSIRTNADPADTRTDRVGGEVSVFGMFVPGWGMHLADMAVAQGDLVRRVGALSARSRTVPLPVSQAPRPVSAQARPKA